MSGAVTLAEVTAVVRSLMVDPAGRPVAVESDGRHEDDIAFLYVRRATEQP